MSQTIYRATAPLRLGLAGGGTDVSPYSDIYNGAVVNATINMFATATITPLKKHELVFHAINQGVRENYQFDEVFKTVSSDPSCIVKATYAHMRELFQFEEKGMEVTIYSEAPVGSGLGSSSTCTIALVSVFSQYFELALSYLDIARLAYDIERNVLKIVGGKQDQYAATFGGFNFMEFYDKEQVIVNPIPIKQKVLQEIQHSLILYYTDTSRVSSDIINRQINNVKKDDLNAVEAMHALKEQAYEMRDCLLKGNVQMMGEILNRGWEAKKRMAKGISNARIQQIMDKAMEAGATGGKISGAGGGGFLFLFCPLNTRYQVVEALSTFKGYVKPFTFVKSGVRSWRQRY